VLRTKGGLTITVTSAGAEGALCVVLLLAVPATGVKMDCLTQPLFAFLFFEFFPMVVGGNGGGGFNG
jgi:hypothetical protein